MVEKSGFFFVIYAIYTVWLVVDLIKNKGKSMTKIVRRAIIFFTIFGWLVYFVLYGNLFSNVPNYDAFQYIIGIVFMIMMWSLVAPYIKLEKGTPEYEMVKGALLLVAASILYIIYVINFY